MPRLFLLSTLLCMTFHILCINGFPPIPRKVYLWPSQPHAPSPVILSPDSLWLSLILSLWKQEGEECPLLFAVVLDLFPGQEPPQLSGCYPSCSSQTQPVLHCFTATVKGHRTTTSPFICCLVYLPNKAGRSFAWHCKTPLEREISRNTSGANLAQKWYSSQFSLNVLSLAWNLKDFTLFPGQGQGCAYHDLPAVYQMLKVFSLIESAEALGLCGTLRMAPHIRDTFSCTESHKRYLTAQLYTHSVTTHCPHFVALKPRQVCLKPQRSSRSAAGTCRAQTAGMSEKLGSLKLSPGRSHFHVRLLLIRPNLCFVAQISEVPCTLEWLTGIHHTGSQAKPSVIPLWPSLLIPAGSWHCFYKHVSRLQLSHWWSNSVRHLLELQDVPKIWKENCLPQGSCGLVCDSA